MLRWCKRLLWMSMMKIIMCQDPLSQGLQVVKIEDNPGILPVKLGYAFVQHDKWLIVKTNNLKGIIKDLEYNIEKYSEFSKIIYQNRSFVSEILELKTHVDYLRDETINKIRQLVPPKRYRRGLINPLGSIIKVVTGNLDHDDAIRYDKLITELKTREQGISNKVTLISEIMDHFLNSTQVINENTRIMNERLKRIETVVTDLSRENMYIFLSHITSVLNMFIANFRTIYIKINEIETALAFSKVSVLHKSVIDSNELLLLLQEISKYDNLMYSVTEHNLINIEETLSVKTYLKNDEIRFIIEVPLIRNCTYSYFKLYPLPMAHDSETFVIFPEYPFLLVEGKRYRPTADLCREITANEYLCSEDDLIPYAPETCIEQLMKHHRNLSRCYPRRVLSEDLKLQRIASTRWILYSRYDKILTQTCGHDTNRENLKGTYIITTSEACDVFIDDVIIQGQRHSYPGIGYKPVPIIALPKIQVQEYRDAKAEPVDLKGIGLEDVQHLNHLLKKSDNGQYNIIESVSVATIVLYIIVFLCVTYFICNKFKNLVIRKRHGNDGQAEDQPQPPILLVSR